MTPQQIYEFDLNLFVRQLLPGLLRREKWLALFDAFLSPVVDLLDAFNEFRFQANYKVAHTAQVVHMEKVLNDAFDDTLRRIYIDNVTFSEYIYLWPQADEEPHHLQEIDADPDNPIFLLQGDEGVLSPDATVWVPIAMQPLNAVAEDAFLTEMRGLIDYYKFFNINYQILYYE